MGEVKNYMIKQTEIAHKCPVCGHKSLNLIFFQKHTFNALYHRTTDEVTHKIQCPKCASVINPTQWSEDMERVFNYYGKMVVADKASVRFTSLFLMLLVAFLGLIFTLLFLVLEEFI